MIDTHAIAALTALARSDSLEEAMPALDRLRSLLGDQALAWRPLIETLTRKALEIAELRRQMRRHTSETQLRRISQAG